MIEYAPPEFKARKGEGPMDEEDVWRVVRAGIGDSIQYVDEELIPDRAKATDYYHGKPFGNEEEGRSKAVLSEVRDGIMGVLPSLLRVLHGPESVVEYVPRRGDQVPHAEQATDYIRYVYEDDNAGFLVTHATLKDGLLKKIGIVKWGMEETTEPVTTVYRGVSRDDVGLMLADGSVTLSKLTPLPTGLFDAELTRMEPGGRLWVATVPPDDFFWNREARTLADALVVGHRTRLTRGELLAKGVSETVLDEHGKGGDRAMSEEEIARRTNAVSGFGDDPELGPENEKVLYCEAFIRMDRDGDGIAERRKVCTVGPTYYPVRDEPADEINFAVFSPDPEPHALIGGSWYDRLKDVQLINSQLLRGMLDSLAISLFPRVAYTDGQASVADILNTAIGAPMRERVPGAIRTFEQPFTGEKVMPILLFMQEVVERRTGQNKGAVGLDMDALQSTGKEAVGAALTASQAQAELLARLYAEQVLKPMFRGLLKLAAHPKSRNRIVRLRGHYVEVTPSLWDANMDVAVTVALGSMHTEKKVATLAAVIADQSAILKEFGPMNPVVSIAMLRNAKAKVLALQGIKDVDSYYRPVPDDWQPPAPPPPAPSEDALWRQAELQMNREKAIKELAIKQDELRLKEQQLAADNAFRERELRLREEDSERRLLEGPHNAEIERYKADTAAATKTQELEQDRVLKTEELALKARELDEKTALATRTLEEQHALKSRELALKEQEVAIAAAAPPPAPTTVGLQLPSDMEPVVAAMEQVVQALQEVADQKPDLSAIPPAEVDVYVEAPPLPAPPRESKRTGTLTAPDGTVYTIETTVEEEE